MCSCFACALRFGSVSATGKSQRQHKQLTRLSRGDEAWGVSPNRGGERLPSEFGRTVWSSPTWAHRHGGRAALSKLPRQARCKGQRQIAGRKTESFMKCTRSTKVLAISWAHGEGLLHPLLSHAEGHPACPCLPRKGCRVGDVADVVARMRAICSLNDFLVWQPRTCASTTHEPLYVYSRWYGATAARLTPDRKIGWEFESLFPQNCVCVKTGRPPEPSRPFQNLGEPSKRKTTYDCVPLGI